MCGIAGFVERDHGSIALEESVRRMVAPLRHRGPDADGVWTDAGAGVGMGHRRLSIIDLSSTGAQPMVSASGRFVISYNGEVYNAEELRKELERCGAVFRGSSDTEVLLEACAAWGIKAAVRRVVGMFAFAIWDRADRSLHLVRDRLGIKPLYYCAAPDRFLFASEITALQAHPKFSGTIDQDAIGAFMTLDYIPAPHTIFQEVRKLRPGRILRVDVATLAAPRCEAYWSLNGGGQEPIQRNHGGSFGGVGAPSFRCGWQAHGERCSARCVPLRGHRFVDCGCSDAEAIHTTREDLLDRIP